MPSQSTCSIHDTCRRCLLNFSTCTDKAKPSTPRKPPPTSYASPALKMKENMSGDWHHHASVSTTDLSYNACYVGGGPSTRAESAIFSIMQTLTEAHPHTYKSSTLLWLPG